MRVEILTREFGVNTMEVLADPRATDVEILDACNDLHVGDKQWTRVIRPATRRPGETADDPIRVLVR